MLMLHVEGTGPGRLCRDTDLNHQEEFGLPIDIEKLINRIRTARERSNMTRWLSSLAGRRFVLFATDFVDNGNQYI